MAQYSRTGINRHQKQEAVPNYLDELVTPIDDGEYKDWYPRPVSAISEKSGRSDFGQSAYATINADTSRTTATSQPEPYNSRSGYNRDARTSGEEINRRRNCMVLGQVRHGAINVHKPVTPRTQTAPGRDGNQGSSNGVGQKESYPPQNTLEYDTIDPPNTVKGSKGGSCCVIL